MIKISVFCNQCGKKVKTEIDPDLPPSSVRCTCGARFELELTSGTESSTAYGGSGSGSESTAPQPTRARSI
jgi:hypothetical protein